MTDPFARLGLAVVRLRWVILAFWIVLILVCGPLFASKAASVLKAGGTEVANSESVKAAQILATQFSQGNPNNATIVLHSPSLTVDDPSFTQQLRDVDQRVASVSGVVGVTGFLKTTNPAFVSKDRHTTIVVVGLRGDETQVQETVAPIRKALSGLSVEHYVTGVPGIDADFAATLEHDLSRAELLTIPLTMVLLLIVFRTVIAAAIPMLLGAASVMLALTAIYLIGSRTDISNSSLNVASMIGLGLGIDFSLIMVSRYREEIRAGRSPDEAVAATMATSGRSITYSAITVMLSMLLLTLLFNLLVVRSISLGVMLVAVTALLAGLTLLPAVLAILGRRIEWLRVIPRGKARRPGEVGFWYRFSHAIMARPWIWLLGSLVFLLILASPARQIDVSGLGPGVFPSGVESVVGVRALNDAFGGNSLSPIQIVMHTEKNGVWKPEFLAAIEQLTNAAAADPRGEQTQSLFTLAQSFRVSPQQYQTLTPEFFKNDPARAAAASQFVNLSGDNNEAVVSIVSKYSQFANEQQDFIHDLRTKTIPGIRQLRVYDVYVGGNSASFVDSKQALYGRFPLLVAAVLVLTYFILMMFFQSVFLPLKAIVLNAVSVLATYGVLVALFQWGWGSKPLGFDTVGKLGLMTPAILFVILFGLSTDYEVFLLSRVKEYFHQTHDNEESVATGLEHTAGVITAAGLILIGVFGSFGAAGILSLKEVGIGLAVGVLLDSTIVRMVMVPATMRLTGNWNWWMPGWLRAIVPELQEGPLPAPALAAASANTGGVGLSSSAGPAGSPLSPSVLGVSSAAGGARLMPSGSSIGTDSVPLTRTQPLRIGRSRDNELQLYDPHVSRYHARIDYGYATFMLADLNSSNGVYVNGQRISPLPQRTPLHDGDTIQISDEGAVTFVFEDGSNAGASGAVAGC